MIGSIIGFMPWIKTVSLPPYISLNSLRLTKSTGFNNIIPPLKHLATFKTKLQHHLAILINNSLSLGMRLL